MKSIFILLFTSYILASYGNVTLTTVYDRAGKDLSFTDIAIDSDDNIWIAMTDENLDKPCLYLFEDGELQSNKCGSWGESDIYIDQNDYKWFIDDDKHMYDGNEWTDVDGYNTPAYIISVGSDIQGNTWIGNFFSVAKYKNGEWEHFEDSLLGDYVHSMTTDLKGNMWFGTSEGVSMFDGANWERHLFDAAPNGKFTCAALDAHGNVWFGTAIGGAYKYDGTDWTHYTKTDGLSSNMITAISADKNGMVWFSTNYGISSFDGVSWEEYRFEGDNGYYHNSIANMVIDSNGDLWMVSSDGIEKVSTGGTGAYRPQIVLDSDDDGTPDSSDAFPYDSNETVDSDNDGVGDNADMFPNDDTETVDSDNDGVGNNADAFPNDMYEWADTDNDGVGDNTDQFPDDSDQSNMELTDINEIQRIQILQKADRIVIESSRNIGAYFIYSQSGQMVLHGNSNTINIKCLTKGVYFIKGDDFAQSFCVQ